VSIKKQIANWTNIVLHYPFRMIPLTSIEDGLEQSDYKVWRNLPPIRNFSENVASATFSNNIY